jgi:indole-3-glycerol phosphate synthase
MLEAILSEKRREIEALKRSNSRVGFTPRLCAGPRLDFTHALRSCPCTPIIAEIKRRSPSKGVLREVEDPAGLARIYEEAGAAAISVLTDGPFFHGSIRDLEKVKDAVGVPVLRKDFILDEVQVEESAGAGADALLLIVAALGDDELENLFHKTIALGMTPLVETHDETEVARALALDPPLIGINNRDLASMRIDVETCLRLRPLVPPHVMVIGESGVQTRDDVRRLEAGGVDAFLVGTALMRSPDPGRALKSLCVAEDR